MMANSIVCVYIYYLKVMYVVTKGHLLWYTVHNSDNRFLQIQM